MTPRSPRAVSASLATSLLITFPDVSRPAVAQPTAVTVATQEQGSVDRRWLLVGAGAIVGTLVFNVFAAPLGTVPLSGGTLEAVPVSVALGSRLIAVTAAGLGAVGGTWLYDRWSGQTSDYGYITTLFAGALGGVVVGNYLSAGILGEPPYYVGAGVANGASVMASPAAQAASRVYVVTTAVFGTWVADWLYRR